MTCCKLSFWLALCFVLSLAGNGQSAELAKEWEHPAFITWKDRSVEEIMKAAAQGDAQAQYYLAWINWFGERGQTNHQQAIHWFQAAATNGVAEAQFKLGVLAEQGIGGPKDAARALVLYNQSASTSNAVVQFKLAFFKGEQQPNRQEADAQLKIAAAQQYLRAAYQLTKGQALGGSNPDWAKFFPVCLTAAEHGIADAQFDLVTAYLGGKGVKVSSSKACQWLWIASASGQAEAKIYLQREHRLFSSEEHSEGKKAAAEFIPKPQTAAHVHWEKLLFHRPDFEFSANKDLTAKAATGDAPAQFELGLTLCHESCTPLPPGQPPVPRVVNGVRQKPPEAPLTPRDLEALKWLHLAAVQEHMEAAFHYGIRVLLRTERTASWDEGLRLLRRAAVEGHREARHQLATYHERLDDSRARLAEAVHWHRLAARDGHPFSQLWMNGFLKTNFMTGAVSPDTPYLEANSFTNSSVTSKLAIIATDAETLVAADLLAAQLSQSDRVTLLERKEIDRILQEQNLSLQQSQGRLKLSELLGADGLIFLQRFAKEGKQWFSMQLVAVRPGVVIQETVSPWPLSDMSAWAQLAASRQILLLPKLSIPKQQAIPLSLLHFSSPMLTAGAVSLDREVTDLLARRLLQYPDIFVLERRRLDQLASEMALESSSSTFWNGSWIVEGEINPEGGVKGELTLRGKLRSPGGGVVEVGVSGARQNLSGLIAELAGKLVVGVTNGTRSAAWDPMDEAAQYYDEARWQFSSRMWTEAQTSAEAAWALGLRMPELAHLRVSAYTAPLPFKGLRRNPGYNVIYPARSPDVNLTVTAVRALDSYQDLQRIVGGQDAKVLEAGVKSLTSSLELLEQLYEVKSALPEDIPLALLRDRVRHLAADLESRPGMLTPISGTSYARTMLMFAPFCEETFEEGLKHYDKLVRKGVYFDLLSTSGGRCFNLAAWDGVNRLEQELAWDKQLEKWRDDADPKVQITAIMASFYGAGSFYEQEEARERLAAFWLRVPRPDIDAQLLLSLWNTLKRIDYPSVPEGERKNWHEQRRQSLLMKLEAQLAPLLQQAGETERDRELPGWNELVMLLTQVVKEKRSLTPDEEKARRMVPILELRHAETLAPLLIEYRKYAKPETNRLFALYAQVAAAYRRAGRPLPEGLEIIQTAGRSKSSTGTKSNSQASASKAVIPLQRANIPPTVMNNAPLPPRLSMTDLNAIALHLPASVPLTADMPGNEQQLDLEILDWVTAKEKLWVEVRKPFTYSWSTGNSAGVDMREGDVVIEVDPQAPQLMKLHWFNTNKATLHGMPQPGGVRPSKRLAVTATDLFWLDGGRLLRKNLASGELRPVNMELPNDGRLTVVGDRLFVTAAEVMLEILPKSESSRVLASIRRRPALGPLDQLTDLSQAILIGGPNNSLRAAINGQVYLFDESSRNWKTILPLPDTRSSRYRKMGDDLMIETPGQSDPALARVASLSSVSDKMVPAVRSHRGVNGQWLMPKEILGWSDDTASPDNLTMSWAWKESSLWFVGHWSIFSPEGNSPILGCFQPNVPNPVIFQPFLSSNDQEKQKWIKSDLHLFAFKESLLMLSPQTRRVICIPKAQVKSSLEKSSAISQDVRTERLKYLQKRMEYWRKVYDSNRNGRLEPDEEATMRSNAMARKDLQEMELLNGR